MFSSEARAFRRSADPRAVRTRPSDTVRNNADNSLSLRSCSSWFEISFIVFPPVRGPAIGAFHAHGTPDPHVRPSGVENRGGSPGLHPGAFIRGKVGETASIPCGDEDRGMQPCLSERFCAGQQRKNASTVSRNTARPVENSDRRRHRQGRERQIPASEVSQHRPASPAAWCRRISIYCDHDPERTNS